MFIFSNYDLLYIIIIFFLLTKLTKIEDEKNNTYYLFNNYKPVRELYDKNTLYDLCKESHIKYFDKEELSKQNFHIILESIVAELIINLLLEKISTSDPYIDVHIKTKIHLLFTNYIILFDIKSNHKKEIYKLNVSLVHRIIDILSEIHIDIFNIYVNMSKFLKKDEKYYNEFEFYISNRTKIDLNYENITFKKEYLVKYSEEFKTNNLKYSKWMYSPLMNIID